MFVLNGRPVARGLHPACDSIRSARQLAYRRPTLHPCRVQAGLELIEKSEASDGSTVFKFGSASEAQAKKTQSKPAQASASASQNSNSQASAAPAQTPPAPEQPKRRVQAPKDGNYSALEVEDLRAIAEERQIVGWKKLRKQQLVDTLKRNDKWGVNH